MTADQLDPAAEARIREACGVDHTPGVWSNCRCYSIRAAILADREAREKPPLMVMHKDGRMERIVEDPERAERAHADALAGASRGFLVSALRFYSSQPAHDDRLEGALAALRDVLAAHDKRRGRRG